MREAVKEITIRATPATIFPYLVDPEKFLQWMGTDVHLDAVAGGEFRVMCGGVNPSAGHFVEVVPNTKVLFTFGWDVPGHPIPAGSSQVEITLRDEGDATVLRLVHRDLPDDAIGDHLRGWNYYLDRLQMVLDGKSPGPDDPTLNR